MEPFISYTTEEEIKKEKIKAQRLRKSQWWKRKCAGGVCYFCGSKLHPKDLTMEHVILAARDEFGKMGKLCTASDFGKYYHLIC